MIGYITGKIIDKKPTEILLDVNGVGYIIHISINTFENISDKADSISLYTFLSVKEDSLTLYGFSKLSEKEMFEKLISVNGIGPKLAQSILSGITVSELKTALQSGDKSRITAVPGIGKKTAERLVVELREKIDSLITEEETIPSKFFIIKEDAINALIALGYNRKVAENATRKILRNNSEITIEELIKKALFELTG